MKRTVLSSLLFLVPAYRAAFVHRAVGDWLMFSVAMVLSAVNHAHSFHPHAARRALFRNLDVAYMYTMGTVVGWQAHAVYGYPLWAVLATAAGVYAVYRGTGLAPLEHYTEAQKRIHVLFHFVAIAALTVARTPFHRIEV
jgi:hypothetical protein